MNLRIACVRVPHPPTAPPAGAEAAALAGALLAAAPRVTQGGGEYGVPDIEATPPSGRRRNRGKGGVRAAEVRELLFWADASGMQRRGGEAAVAQALLAAARDTGFTEARVGVAGSCVAAVVATRVEGTAWRVVPADRDAAFLGRRPLDFLPLEPEMREALRLLGLTSCGELAEFAAADVELRWGAAGVRAWRLARGDDPRWPFRPPPPDRAAAEARWETPIEGAEPLRFVLRGLIAAVVGQIARRQKLPAALHLVLELADGGEAARALRPARPTAEARVLAGLCEQALEELAGGGGLQAPVSGIRLEAIAEGAALADQLDIFRPAAPDPAAVHAALAPLLARWGDAALSRAIPRGAHLPGAHAVWEPVGQYAIAELTRPRPPLDTVAEEEPGSVVAPGVLALPAASLSLCLRRFPAPREVGVTTDAKGRPKRLRRGKAKTTGAGELPRGGPVRAEGPERLSGGWWADGYAREYWLVEAADGGLWLLFRDVRDGAWWVEGWWD